ncbi:hypothetical protein CB1_001600002 [Camelus ferus]|nr:hypothetical protein CB1_001600002 [Camelus ferus]
MVALSFGALSLSSSPQVKNSCPFWAGSSVKGFCFSCQSNRINPISSPLGDWKNEGRWQESGKKLIKLSTIEYQLRGQRPYFANKVNLFVLLSVVCVLLNLAGFILGCQGAQFVSSVPRCDLVDLGEGKICFCCEEFQPAKCTDKENALKLFPVQPCSAVHLLLKKVLFALCALNALTTTVCLVAAALRYLQIFAARRSCNDESQISAEEVEEHRRIPDPDDFVPPVPPPSYFATFYSCTPRMNRRMVGPDVIPLPHIYGARIKGVEVFCPLDPPPPYEAVVSQTDQQQGSPFQMPDGPEAATSPLEPICIPVTQDYKSYMDTKLLVARFLEQSSCRMTPDIHELVENIKSVLKSDEEHMEEAITSASFLEQIMAPTQPSPPQAHVLPSRRRPGLLHLRSCGDLSTFVPAGRPRAERRPRRAEAERPHSLIGVIRETVL